MAPLLLKKLNFMYLILLKSFYRCKDNTFFELSVINWIFFCYLKLFNPINTVNAWDLAEVFGVMGYYR